MKISRMVFREGFWGRLVQTILCVCLLCSLSGCFPKHTAPETNRTPTKPAFLVHQVKYSGETLSIISAWYTGNPNNWDRILKVNPKLDPKRMKLGESINIPIELVVKEVPLSKSAIESAQNQARKNQPPAEQVEVKSPASNIKIVERTISDEEIPIVINQSNSSADESMGDLSNESSKKGKNKSAAYNAAAAIAAEKAKAASGELMPTPIAKTTEVEKVEEPISEKPALAVNPGASKQGDSQVAASDTGRIVVQAPNQDANQMQKVVPGETVNANQEQVAAPDQKRQATRDELLKELLQE